jgi:hypothetical protein
MRRLGSPRWVMIPLFVMFLWDFIVNDVLLELWMAIGYMQ